MHVFEAGDHVTLGGVRIPHAQGIRAHSDGDVLLHALCDALLGAAALGDIGMHFPDTDPRWRGADSRVFLRHVRDLLRKRSFAIVNVDTTVLAEAPRLGKHRETMRANIAADLRNTDRIASTSRRRRAKGMGFIGRREGLACHAIALIELAPSVSSTSQARCDFRARMVSRWAAASIRATPEDFVVREWLGFEADGEGDHWLLKVRKRGANTHWVAKQLAQARRHSSSRYRLCRIEGSQRSHRAVVYGAGALSGRIGLVGTEREMVSKSSTRNVIDASSNAALSRATISRSSSANSQVTRTRFTSASRRSLLAACRIISVHSASATNSAICDERSRCSAVRSRRTIASSAALRLSAARAAIFNACIRASGRGKERGIVCIEGDVANLDGSNSIFVVEAIDEMLIERCAQLDIHPTGPLWGRGELQDDGTGEGTGAGSRGGAASTFAKGSPLASLDQERRPLRIRVQTLEHTLLDDVLTLRFRLGRGAFATTVLHELFADAFDQATPETDE